MTWRESLMPVPDPRTSLNRRGAVITRSGWRQPDAEVRDTARRGRTSELDERWATVGRTADQRAVRRPGGCAADRGRRARPVRQPGAVAAFRWLDRDLGIPDGPQTRLHRGAAGRHRRADPGPTRGRHPAGPLQHGLRASRSSSAVGCSPSAPCSAQLGDTAADDAELDLPGRWILLLHRRLRRAGAGTQLAARYRRGRLR